MNSDESQTVICGDNLTSLNAFLVSEENLMQYNPKLVDKLCHIDILKDIMANNIQLYSCDDNIPLGEEMGEQFMGNKTRAVEEIWKEFESSDEEQKDVYIMMISKLLQPWKSCQDNLLDWHVVCAPPGAGKSNLLTLAMKASSYVANDGLAEEWMEHDEFVY